MTCRRVVIAAVVAASLAGCGGDPERDPSGDRVGVVIKGLDNPYFEAMRQGVTAAARERGADVSVGAATGLDDTAGQAQKLEALIEEDLDCYVVNPISQANLVQALSHVPEGVPIVNVDSAVGEDEARALAIEVTTYVGTDNHAAGELGAKAMEGFVDQGATVAVIGGISGDASSTTRVEGFMDGAQGRFRTLGPVSADWDERKARLAAAAVLREEPGVEGFFAVNDQMALGVAKAVAAAGRRGEVAVIGVDGIEPALDAVRRGALSATVSQYPYTIGVLGVEACLAAAAGETLPARVDAPVQVVTRRNVARARENFPEPVEPFESPFAALLK